VGLERGPLGLLSTVEELLERKSSGSGLENRDYGPWDPSRWPRGTLYKQKLALTSPTSGGRSVGIVRSRTEATEFSLVLVLDARVYQHFDRRESDASWPWSVLRNVSTQMSEHIYEKQ
jgi:hypothetical protein